jgi:hypothetical protein
MTVSRCPSCRHNGHLLTSFCVQALVRAVRQVGNVWESHRYHDRKAQRHAWKRPCEEAKWKSRLGRKLRTAGTRVVNLRLTSGDAASKQRRGRVERWIFAERAQLWRRGAQRRLALGDGGSAMAREVAQAARAQL